ncbi:MAG TPA: 5'/3'-nucleotidase SurE [Cytophagaceae bacterium]|jgi:5'-nucleotidase|nr:5'/3'-nucleotidase SurE [Cytophagaceae bacterium]
MNAKPLILVTNDDGITSFGIRTLIEVMKELGEVVVVAPDSPQSGMGHAITIGYPLRLDETDIYGEIKAYECSGTPADCVKLAKNYVLRGRTPDLVVSGINHGSNSSTSVLYSGTMSAAIEAAIEGLPAIGFSLCDYKPRPDFSHIKEYVKKISLQVLKNNPPVGVALNVNFPIKSANTIKGIKICRQAIAKWHENFEERHDPNGRRYFWMSGIFINTDNAEDTDEWALNNNYISIVPCAYDMTAHYALGLLNRDWEILKSL